MTVLPAGPDDRAELTERLARLMARVRGAAPTSPSIAIGPADFTAASREAVAPRSQLLPHRARERSAECAMIRVARRKCMISVNR